MSDGDRHGGIDCSFIAAETTVSACASTEVAAGAGRAAFVASGTVESSNDERSEQQTSTEHAGDPILGTVVLLLLSCICWELRRRPPTPTTRSGMRRVPATRPRVAAVLDKGVDVNAKARYGATALFFAADKGHLETVKLLVARGAEINLEDTFYRFKPIDLALENGHADVGIFLLEKGAKGGGFALISGVRSNNAALVKAALKAPDVDRRALHGQHSRSRNARSAPIWRRRSRRRWTRCRRTRRRRYARPGRASAVCRAVSERGSGSNRNHRHSRRSAGRQVPGQPPIRLPRQARQRSGLVRWMA